MTVFLAAVFIWGLRCFVIDYVDLCGESNPSFRPVAGLVKLQLLIDYIKILFTNKCTLLLNI